MKWPLQRSIGPEYFVSMIKMIVSLFETKTVRHFGRSACGWKPYRVSANAQWPIMS
jgi:hypothetical protein